MKTLRWIALSFLITSMLFLVAACGGEEQTPAGEVEPTAAVVAQATDTPMPEPTDTPVPLPTETLTPSMTGSEEPAETTESELPKLGSLESLNSFRSEMVMTWTGVMTDGTETSGSMIMNTEFVRDPPAQHVTITGDAETMTEMGMEDGGALEMYVVDNRMYMNFLGGWMQMPAEEGDLDVEAMTLDTASGMLSNLEKAKYEGRTTYNGVDVKHYTFDESYYSDAELIGMNIDEASGNLYIAVDGNYLVHMNMLMKGANFEVPNVEADLQSGSLEITLDVTDINAPISIVAPQEAVDSGKPPEDIPIPENAEEFQVIAMMGMITFVSPATPAEVADFFKAEMPKNGWTESSAQEFDDLFMLDYSKDGKTASVMITKDEDTGKTSVLITIPTEE